MVTTLDFTVILQVLFFNQLFVDFCFFLFNFRYASLYFCCCVEHEDNELLTLEIIHRYVELLDKYFGNVSSKLSR